ncbi:MAG TPA: hypothetical protein VNN18_04375 [Candidatus Xenobia bacterium]|nr:hypothetical protein [Candidatus Xenobia bacterium]
MKTRMTLLSLAVLLVAVAFGPQAAQAAEVSASLTSDTSGTLLAGPIVGQPGVTITTAFYVMVDVQGRPGNAPTADPRISLCNNIQLNADGSFTCFNVMTIYLVKGNNYTTTKTDTNGNTFPMFVPVQLVIAEGVPCPATYDLLEALQTYSGTGVDFGGGVLSLNLPFQVEVECWSEQGCSHGYWKNKVLSWPDGYETTNTISSLFTIPASMDPSLGDITLLGAMQFTGPGNTLNDAARILFQQAVAAVLNAEHPDVEYPMTKDEIVTAVDAALASGDRDAILALKDQLDAYNNLGCPLN